MAPEDLASLLTSLKVAADVVEAIDDPELQVQRGWGLLSWRYELVPWGVRFLRHDGDGEVDAEVVAVSSHRGSSTPLPGTTRASRPTTLLLLE